MAPTPNIIQHENASRRMDVSCNVAGRDLGSVAREIEQKVRSIRDPGYHSELLGEYAARQAGRRRLLARRRHRPAALHFTSAVHALQVHAETPQPRHVLQHFVGAFMQGPVVVLRVAQRQ